MSARRLIYKLWNASASVSRYKRLVLLCLVLTSLVLSPNAASAQSASFRSVDTNSDGVLTFNELVAAFGRNGANSLLRRIDHNGDRRITILELRRGPIEENDRRSGSANDRDDDRDDDDQDDDDDGGDDDGGDDGDDDGGDDGGDDD